MSLPPELQTAWNRAAAAPGKPVDIGRTVVCDSCNGDYTNRSESGGFIFGSYAYCPACEKRHLAAICRYGEEHYVRRCPVGVPFSDFVRSYRGPDGNTITIHMGDRP